MLILYVRYCLLGVNLCNRLAFFEQSMFVNYLPLNGTHCWCNKSVCVNFLLTRFSYFGRRKKTFFFIFANQSRFKRNPLRFVYGFRLGNNNNGKCPTRRRLFRRSARPSAGRRSSVTCVAAMFPDRVNREREA